MLYNITQELLQLNMNVLMDSWSMGIQPLPSSERESPVYKVNCRIEACGNLVKFQIFQTFLPICIFIPDSWNNAKVSGCFHRIELGPCCELTLHWLLKMKLWLLQGSSLCSHSLTYNEFMWFSSLYIVIHVLRWVHVMDDFYCFNCVPHQNLKPLSTWCSLCK